MLRPWGFWASQGASLPCVLSEARAEGGAPGALSRADQCAAGRSSRAQLPLLCVAPLLWGVVFPETFPD